jgi:hypothetical protein
MDNPTAATDRWLMTGTGDLRFAAAPLLTPPEKAKATLLSPIG